jgi:hypothetical protein
MSGRQDGSGSSAAGRKHRDLGLARKAGSRENRGETLTNLAAYDRSVMVGLSTFGRFAACSAQFS